MCIRDRHHSFNPAAWTARWHQAPSRTISSIESGLLSATPELTGTRWQTLGMSDCLEPDQKHSNTAMSNSCLKPFWLGAEKT
eukprot:1360724-Rhodomonas_salina.1